MIPHSADSKRVFMSLVILATATLCTAGCSISNSNEHKSVTTPSATQVEVHEATCNWYLAKDREWQLAHGNLGESKCLAYRNWLTHFMKTAKPNEVYSVPPGPIVKF
jgi:hypothetical protein